MSQNPDPQFDDLVDSPETAIGDRPNWGPKTLAFLAAIRKYPNITSASKAAGVRREAHYRRLEGNPAYREAFDRAFREGIDACEEEAVRRSVIGVSRPVLYHGKPVWVEVDPGNPDAGLRLLMETEYSDTLLLAILRARKPEYREKVEQQLVGKDGERLKLEVVFVDAPASHERRDT